MNHIVALILSIAVAQSAGILGAVATSSSVKDWYPTLEKPAFNPPSWLFGPVWVTLYTFMGIAAWLVWKQGWDDPAVRTALYVYGAQLALNAAWSPVFFGAKELGWALVVIVLMLVAILATTYLFFQIDTWAGALFVPYIAWVGFATVLNFAIWQMN
ncbi:MAG: TspO/MBR family protein [Myxococcota bacterium]